MEVIIAQECNITKEQAKFIVNWLKDNPSGSFGIRYTRPNLVSFYGEPNTDRREFRVYLRHEKTQDIKCWSVRYVGYQFGKGFETFDSLEDFFTECRLIGYWKK